MIKINKASDLSLQIYFPNFNTTTPFVLEFYTNATCLSEDPFIELGSKSPNLNVIRASYSPECGYEGCVPWSGGVYICTENTMNDKGDLYCRASFKTTSPCLEDGVRHNVIDFKTDIEIVNSGGSLFFPAVDVETLVIPSYNSVNTQPVVTLLLPGNRMEFDNLDYASTVERPLFGQFWIGRDGSKKQLYGRRVSLSGMFDDYGEDGGGCAIANIVYADTIFEVTGYYAIDESYVNNQTSWNTFFINSLSSKMQLLFLHHNSWIFTPNRLGMQILTGTKDTIGAQYKIELFVKYTKL